MIEKYGNENKYNYSIEDMIGITDCYHEIFLIYLDEIYFINYRIFKFKKNLFKRKKEARFCFWHIKENHIKSVQKFVTAEELYKNATIDGKKICDIWDQIVIDDILGNVN